MSLRKTVFSEVALRSATIVASIAGKRLSLYCSGQGKPGRYLGRSENVLQFRQGQSASRYKVRKKSGVTHIRSLWCNFEDATYIREELEIPDCQIAVRVDYATRDADGHLENVDSRYYISSLNPDHTMPDDLLDNIRRHWEVENSLHFTKDRWWDEDRHHTRRPGLADRFASLTNAALSVLRFLRKPDQPLRATADLIQWSPQDALTRLGFKK